MKNADVRLRVQTLLDDQRAAPAYLRDAGWKMVGDTGTRWRRRDGMLSSFRNALALAVRAELEDSGG